MKDINFIAIEGIDGAGKSTAIGFIKKYLEKQGKNITITREPGGTPLAEKIRNLVLDNSDENVYSDTELLLMYASRAQHINQLIKPSIENGNIVVCDRFYWSSIAYQGAGRGIDIGKINSLNELFVTIKPDITIYLDIDPKIGLQRAKKVGSPDRMEKQTIEFFEKTRACFKELVKKDDSAYEIDASQSLKDIKSHIIRLIHF